MLIIILFLGPKDVRLTSQQWVHYSSLFIIFWIFLLSISAIFLRKLLSSMCLSLLLGRIHQVAVWTQSYWWMKLMTQKTPLKIDDKNLMNSSDDKNPINFSDFSSKPGLLKLKLVSGGYLGHTCCTCAPLEPTSCRSILHSSSRSQ